LAANAGQASSATLRDNFDECRKADMSAKKLDQYTGKLDAAQVAFGMNAAAGNAKRLGDDSALLLDAGRFASATALAILSIEESGKLSILRQLATAQSAEQVNSCWHEYRSHTKKNVMGAFLDFFAKGARHLGQFAPLFDPHADHPHLLDHVKQIAIYSDCLGSAHWSEPAEVIEESLARRMVQTAQILAKQKEVSPLEIELWIKHVGPHLHGNLGDAERALEIWYAEMQRHGLEAPGPNAMAQFVNKGVDGADLIQ
jgi:AbiV family abortive infection protein